MEKNYKIAVGLLTVSIIMIIAGTVSAFIVSLSDDREKTQARMVVVSDSFKKFSDEVSAFELERDKLYTETLGNIYFETLRTDDTLVKTKLNNYESIVNTLTKDVNVMDDLCKDVYYPDSNINNKCSNYKLIYEQVINNFLNDVKLYNDTIDVFNNNEIKKGSTFALIKYMTNKKYIDYNSDGIFEGKED